MDQAGKEPRHFDMVEIDSRVVGVLASQPKASLRNWFGSAGKPPGATVAVGDTVSLSIWEGNNGQVLMPRQMSSEGGGAQTGGAISIPDQVVGADGAISVPFAGRIPAAGRTPFQIQQTIEQRLAQQVVQPQVIATVSKAAANSVTVLGEQATAARVPLSGGGSRLLEVIAAAGGSKAPFYETSIRLTRNGQTTKIPMTAVVSNPDENIYVWPGDVITLLQTPDKFSVFGATTSNTQIPFGADRLDLAQAIAKSGGLLDARADPEGVFLFRFERPEVVSALGVPDLARETGRGSPIVYHLNLRRVDGYFLAQDFAIQDNDLIYVANARMAELQKFLTLVGSITGPVIGGTVVVRGVSH
jgi:polysaccharide export outer membrane protein